jgi:hypothetical protein
MVLDEFVARSLHRWHLLERALHDSGPWSLSCQGKDFPATRTVLLDRVEFHAFLVALAAGEDLVELSCAGQLVDVRACTITTRQPYYLRWSIVPEGVLT